MQTEYLNHTVNELWRKGDTSIGVFDKDNFYVGKINAIKDKKSKNHGKENLTDVAYFGSIDKAIKHGVNGVAKGRAQTLSEYIDICKATWKDIKDTMEDWS